MSLLIYAGNPDWMADEDLKQKISKFLPGTRIYCGIPQQSLPDVEMLAVTYSVESLWAKLPNLKLVQKLGAGVNLILDDPHLPKHIRITRLAPTDQAREIAEYCLLYILSYQRHVFNYLDQAETQSWIQHEPMRNSEATVGVLGLGRIGQKTAELIASFGFRVLGWSRTEKSIDRIACYCGEDGLSQVLHDADYVVSILPSTAETTKLINSRTLSQFKNSSIFINVGRGDLVDEEALLSALNNNQIGGAVLDVFAQEPLPTKSELWSHPAVKVTPHVSGWSIESGLQDIAENYLRLKNNQPLLHEVDREIGY